LARSTPGHIAQREVAGPLPAISPIRAEAQNFPPFSSPQKIGTPGETGLIANAPGDGDIDHVTVPILPEDAWGIDQLVRFSANDEPILEGSFDLFIDLLHSIEGNGFAIFVSIETNR
jgi:hypothetical protein